MTAFWKIRNNWFHLTGAVVLSGWVMALLLLLPFAGSPRIVEADDTHPGSEQSKDDQESFSPEDRPAPPRSDVNQSNVPEELQEHEYVYRVEYVLDGDSIRLENGKELRLIGVDAPEEGKPFADAARKAVRSMIPEGSIVAVDLDRRWWDRYDRLLGYVYTIHREREQGARKILINERLVKRGLARTYLHRRNTTFIDRLIAAQRSAIREERGLFKHIEESKEQYFRVRDHFRFHHPDCRYVREIPEKFLIKYRTKREALREGCNAASCCKP